MSKVVQLNGWIFEAEKRAALVHRCEKYTEREREKRVDGCMIYYGESTFLLRSLLCSVISTLYRGGKMLFYDSIRNPRLGEAEKSLLTSYAPLFIEPFIHAVVFSSILIREIPAMDFTRDFSPDESGFEMTNLMSFSFRLKASSLKPIPSDTSDRFV
jgi:hypothetical protein